MRGGGRVASKIVRGTLVLFAAGLFARILGFVYRIALARELGAQGMGLLSMAQPVIFFAVTLATAGLPVAISKVVAERAAVRPKAVREVLRVSLVLVLAASALFTVLLLLLSGFISHHLLSDPRALMPLLALVPMLGVVAVSVVYRGYLQGLQDMVPGAFAQGAEQVVRLVLVFLMVPMFVRQGIAMGAFGAALALVAGEAAGLAVLLGAYRLRQGRVTDNAMPDAAGTLRELLAISLPVTLTRLVASVTDLADAVVIPRRLEAAGFTTDRATAFFGNLYGMAMPLLFFPTVFTFALAQNLVPAVSDAYARNDLALVRRRTDQAIQLGVLIALPTSAVFLLLGHSLGLLFYGSAPVGDLIAPLAFAAPFLYLEVSVSAVLRGLGRAAQATMNGLVGSVVRLILVYTLAGNPRIGIAAVIVGISIDLAISFFLNLGALMKAISMRADPYAWCVRPLVASIPLFLLLRPLQAAARSAGMNLWLSTGTAIVVGAAVFIAGALLVGVPLSPRSIR